MEGIPHNDLRVSTNRAGQRQARQRRCSRLSIRVYHPEPDQGGGAGAHRDRKLYTSTLGVEMVEVSTLAAEQNNLPSAGILMQPSRPDSPAAQAGLPERSIVTAIDGEELTSSEDVIASLELNTSPGDTVTLTIAGADGAHCDLQVMVGSQPRVASLETMPSSKKMRRLRRSIVARAKLN